MLGVVGVQRDLRRDAAYGVHHAPAHRFPEQLQAGVKVASLLVHAGQHEIDVRRRPVGLEAFEQGDASVQVTLHAHDGSAHHPRGAHKLHIVGMPLDALEQLCGACGQSFGAVGVEGCALHVEHAHLLQRGPAGVVRTDEVLGVRESGFGIFVELREQPQVDVLQIVAHQLRPIVEQLVQREVEVGGDARQQSHVGHALLQLPLRHGRLRHAQVRGQLALRHLRRTALARDGGSQVDVVHARLLLSVRRASRPTVWRNANG